MNEYFKIAWRNLWRNRRRTLITVGSVFFALFLALSMRSMQLGTYRLMVESAVKNTTGYIQIHEKGYWNDKSIDNTLVYTDDLREKISQTENVSEVIPRLESFALISSGKQTKGVGVIGTIPEIENKISGLAGRITSGEYLTEGRDGILLAEGLANYLDVKVNDSVVLLGQGYHGVTAAAELPVVGIVRFLQPDMNNQLTYMSLSRAQDLFESPGRLTSISLMLDDPDRINHTVRSLSAIDPENLEVMSWKELLHELLNYIEGDNITGLFILAVLYMVVGFGIFGTILMMTMERRKEFGIMVAVGMKRMKLSLIILIESVIIGITGIIAGTAFSFPLILYFYYHPIKLTGEMAQAMLEYNMEPIMPFALEPGFFSYQAIVVIIITLLAALYPVTVISKLKVVRALKGK
jgi:ABC-type lipoprotein release transport system permease subunit